jgi:ketosteroid isomerase-like protein
METNADLLRTGYDAWNRDDCQGWLDLLHEDVEISTAGVFPDLAAEYRGHERARKFWHQLHEPWESFRIDVERIEEDGDLVLGTVRFRGKGSDSGVEVDMRFGNVIHVRDGKATAMVNRRTVEEAREALLKRHPVREPQPR